jgi:hypothetical protein
MSKELKQTATECSKARNLRKQLGTTVAAGYLRNRGYSIEATLRILSV